MLFLSLLAAQLGVALGLRARLLTTANLFLPASVAGSALLGAAALYVPALQSLLHTVPVDWRGLCLAAGAALAAFAAARLLRSAFHGSPAVGLPDPPPPPCLVAAENPRRPCAAVLPRPCVGRVFQGSLATRAARPASSRAEGTRKGEQET
ncbi:cation transporting ATPase C-terminal domain-containing protein [Streptomyces sp. NBC_01431]|uniref:cation transporting ATPase C-terminal domain-containing protein n=1 Tax=Streptomyces sp. NBC_01431 TaxID=2903863 RepID=UPI003FCE6128